MSKKVVITGIGAVTPCGNDVDSYWNSIIQGKSGAGEITQFDSTEFSVKIAAEVKDFDPTDYVDRKEARRMDRFCQFAIAASDMAIKDAELDFDKFDRNRIGVIVGSGIGGIRSHEKQNEILLTKGPSRISPFFIVLMIADIAPGHISIRHGLKGPNYAVTSACATATHAIGDAYRTIQRGDADIIVCGGAEAAISPMGVGGFASMKALTFYDGDPAKASRPFDLNRNGFLMGEGSGILILESEEVAVKRGAKIYGELAGIGFTGDAHHITAPAPNGEGAVRAMNLAIADAGMTSDEIEYINAHGTSTPFNDKTETAAIKTVFGDYAKDLHISSTKSMTGHLLGASGGVEAIAAIKAMETGIIPPTINLDTPDPECDLNYTPNTAVKKPVRTILSNTFGFGGHNACVVAREYKQ